MKKQWSVRVPDEVWSIIESHAALHRVSAAEAMSDLVRRGHSQPDATAVFVELSCLKELVKQSSADVRDQIRAVETKVDALPSKAFVHAWSVFSADISGISTGTFGQSKLVLSVKAKPKDRNAAGSPPSS